MFGVCWSFYKHLKSSCQLMSRSQLVWAEDSNVAGTAVCCILIIFSLLVLLHSPIFSVSPPDLTRIYFRPEGQPEQEGQDDV